jgi:hypothetical protein
MSQGWSFVVPDASSHSFPSFEQYGMETLICPSALLVYLISVAESGLNAQVQNSKPKA